MPRVVRGGINIYMCVYAYGVWCPQLTHTHICPFEWPVVQMPSQAGRTSGHVRSHYNHKLVQRRAAAVAFTYVSGYFTL